MRNTSPWLSGWEPFSHIASWMKLQNDKLARFIFGQTHYQGKNIFLFFNGQLFQLYNNFLKIWHDIPSTAAEVTARQNICAAKSCHGMNKQNPTGVLVHNYTSPNLIWSLFLSAGIICLALWIGIILLLQVPQPLCLHSLLHFSSSFSFFHISPSPPPLAMFLYLLTFN